MFVNNFDPVAFQIFSIEIRWYSLAYIIGILMGWIFSKKIFIYNNELRDKFDDYVTYLILGIIIGGRLGYVIFYNFNYYINNLTDILKVWQGGMSFHGGLLGIIFASILFAKKNNHNPFKYLDVVAIVSPIGIFFGRMANFINSELYGIETNLPWGVKFLKIDNLYRHPSQIYEAIFEGIILFFILLYFRNKSFMKLPGMISGLFLILNLTMGQIMCFLFFLIGTFLIIKKNEA